jgi:hypothetical protein
LKLLSLIFALHLVTADKGSTGAQATFGLQRDTHLVGQQFACESRSDAVLVKLNLEVTVLAYQ